VTNAPRYHPFYCEENVWHLARQVDDLGIHDAHAVFISNHDRTVAIWSQRNGDPGRPAVYDYHVVLLGRRGERWTIFDLDCIAGFEQNVADWIVASFPLTGALPEDVEPLFRVVDVPTFLAEFRTDRSHMRDGHGGWYEPPPDWPPPHSSSNLWDFVDPDGEAPGEVVDLHAFVARWAG
jgi:hypothetical protein